MSVVNDTSYKRTANYWSGDKRTFSTYRSRKEMMEAFKKWAVDKEKHTVARTFKALTLPIFANSIYVYLNKITSAIYVGKTTKSGNSSRPYDHYIHALKRGSLNSSLESAIRINGMKAFMVKEENKKPSQNVYDFFNITCGFGNIAESQIDDLQLREIIYIQTCCFNSNIEGLATYNKSSGGYYDSTFTYGSIFDENGNIVVTELTPWGRQLDEAFHSFIQTPEALDLFEKGYSDSLRTNFINILNEQLEKGKTMIRPTGETIKYKSKEQKDIGLIQTAYAVVNSLRKYVKTYTEAQRKKNISLEHEYVVVAELPKNKEDLSPLSFSHKQQEAIIALRNNQKPTKEQWTAVKTECQTALNGFEEIDKNYWQSIFTAIFQKAIDTVVGKQQGHQLPITRGFMARSHEFSNGEYDDAKFAKLTIDYWRQFGDLSLESKVEAQLRSELASSSFLFKEGRFGNYHKAYEEQIGIWMERHRRNKFPYTTYNHIMTRITDYTKITIY